MDISPLFMQIFCLCQTGEPARFGAIWPVLRTETQVFAFLRSKKDGWTESSPKLKTFVTPTVASLDFANGAASERSDNLYGVFNLWQGQEPNANFHSSAKGQDLVRLLLIHRRGGVSFLT
jgi:hypothetical protein